MIRASELGQFAYCRRAWWLSAVQGHPPANLDDLSAGTRRHRKHGRGVSLARTTALVGRIFAALGVLALVAYILIAARGG